MSDNIIQLNADLIHTELKDLVKNSVEETLNAMLDAEADKLVNAERYARDEQRKGYRAGHYDRSFSTTRTWYRVPLRKCYEDLCKFVIRFFSHTCYFKISLFVV